MFVKTFSGALLLTVGLACSSTSSRVIPNHTPSTVEASAPSDDLSIAVFAGWCFGAWRVIRSHARRKICESGHTGGEIEGPSYRQVAGKQTDHVEAVRVVYDSKTAMLSC